MSEDILHALRVALALGLATDLTVNKMAEEIVDTLGIPAETLAGLRDGSLVAVPILGSTLMHTKIARAHHMSEARVAAIWRGCIATFHPDLMARAITEADSRVAAILATAAPEAARDDAL